MSALWLIFAYAGGIVAWGLARMPAVLGQGVPPAAGGGQPGTHAGLGHVPALAPAGTRAPAPPGPPAPVEGDAGALVMAAAVVALWAAGLAARGLAVTWGCRSPRRGPAAPGGGGSGRARRAGHLWVVTACAVAAVAGFTASERFARAALIPGPWAGTEPVTVTGRVASDPEPGAAGGAFLLQVEDLNGTPVRARLRVLWRRGPGEPAPILGYGDRVRVTGSLRRPRPATNPGGYDRRAALLRQGIGYELASESPPRWLGPPRGRYRLAAAVYVLRACLREGLERSLPPGPRGVAEALLLDWRDELSVTARSALAETGLIHLLAVSGQHVAMAALGVGWLAARSGLLPGPRRVLVAAVVATYAGVTGGPPPVLRATATYLLADLGRALARPAISLAVLAWAAAAQLAFRPLWLFDPGFQLSFAATFGLIVLFPPLWRGLRRWAGGGAPARGRRAALWAAEGLAVTAAAQAAVLPVQVALFGRMPLTALAANLAAVPISGVALVGTAAAAAGGWLSSLLEPVTGPAAGTAARWIGWPARAAIEALVRTAMAAEAFPLGTVRVAPVAAGPLAVALGWIVVLVMDARPAYARRLRPRRLPRASRFWPALLLVIAAWVATRVAEAPPPPGTFEALFLDVGQGDGILLRFPGGRTLQVDAGGRARPADPGLYWPGPPPAIPDAVGEGVTAPVLRRLLPGSLDVLAVTHADRDHAGGAGAVLELVGARELWLGGVPGSALEAELIDLARRRGVPARRPRAGMRWRPAPGCAVDVLHPGDRPVASERAAENNESLVLRVQCGGPRLLLAGDLEREGEEALLARGAELRAEVLKVSHHGSRGASHPAFLAAVRPRLAIVSVGANPYGLPHVEALARLLRAGAVVLRTDELGAIWIRFGRQVEVFPALPVPPGRRGTGPVAGPVPAADAR